MSDPYQILIRPLLTEKSVEAGKQNKYCFQVSPGVNKLEIRQAVEQLFPGVKVAKVNTLMVKGKLRRTAGYGRRRRQPGRTPDWKKAIVTLSEGKIPVFEGL